MIAIKPTLSAMLRSRSGPLLLLAQIILSVAIVANAAFIIQQRLELMARPSGITETESFEFSVFNFGEDMDLLARDERDLEILRSLPGIKAAAPTNMVPLSGSGWSDRFVDGPDPENAKSLPQFAFYLSDEELVNALGLRLVEGRNFHKGQVLKGFEDKSIQREVILSQTLARAFWGEESPIGKVVYQGDDEPITVVGVVERLQGAWVDDMHLENSVIMNIDFNGSSPNAGYIIRAEAADIPELKETIKAALLKDEPRRVISGFSTIAENRERNYANHAMMAFVLGCMIVLLLVITALGLSGMVMFNIERRTKQIGTRRALGASKGAILSWFLTENYLILGTGALVGVLLAFELGRRLMSFFSLPALDWRYPAMTVVLLFVVTTVAVILPARKAANISPATATRSV
ncbi:ABC transporter permease [Shewanella litorisediminis]|uniref:FtsX-like permease family protein n=1 Tax=Shewanella litorisediminis TaxID=1173586 RepID=A0ABX7G1B0_9GAMM|nr:FtsX-like permease family protein [Shewanella litorisediminis]MCL2919047.1 FtsX-like permease family protein [Shewanella litorisediminis]QRH01110.1 FtsX-like permease family protein [Shewanella litorisediminis]